MDLRKLKKQLLMRIDTSDYLEVKKVEDLIRLYELDSACDRAIRRDGATIVVENGNQQFIKTHPALAEKLKINAQKIALEKTIRFYPVQAPSEDDKESEEQPKRGGLI